MGPSDRNVLEVQGLTVRFDTSERSVVAVKDLGFHVRAGEVLAIVGESGSGKSVTSLSVMRLIEHGGGTIASGKISFTRRNGGKLDLAKAADSVMRRQADGFLQALPDGLQQTQTLAVEKAIAGDNAALMAVRNSRNTRQTLSENVSVRQLSESLRLYEPSGVDGRLPLLVYFHGGGWTFGSLNSCARFCDAVAAMGGVKVLAVDYRLAPEHPFPCGLHDCCDAVAYARDNAALLGIDASRISAGGDSSGGNLALAVALSDECRGALESLVLFYPVTKAFADGSESWRKYGSGYGLDADLMEAFNRAYLGGTDSENHAVSVGLCSGEQLRRLPRTLLVAAGRDILRDQGCELAEKSGGRIERVEFPDAVHLFITVPGQDEAFRKAVDLTYEFIIQKQ